MASDKRTRIAVGAAGAILVVVLLAWLLWWDAAPGSPSAAPGAEAATVAPRDRAELGPPLGVDEAEPAIEEEEPEPEATATPAPPRETDRPLVADPGRDLGGFGYELEVVAVDGHDHPLAEASVYLAPSLHRLVLLGPADGEGRFRLRWLAHVPQMEVVVAVAGPGKTWTGLRRLDIVAGAPRVLRLALHAERNFDPTLTLEEREALARLPRKYMEEDERTGYPGAVASTPLVVIQNEQPVFVGRSDHDREQRKARNYFRRYWEQRRLIETGRRQLPDAVAPQGEGATLVGTVKNAIGEPAVSALVAIGPTEGGAGLHGVYTDSSGTFEMVDVRAEFWHARAGGGKLGRAYSFGTLMVGGETRWDFVLERGVELAGELLASDGRPLSNVLLELESEGASVSWNDFTRSGDNGELVVPNVGDVNGEHPAGFLRLHVHAREYVSRFPLMTFPVADAGGYKTLRLEDNLGALSVQLSGIPEDDDVQVRLWQMASGRGIYLEEDAQHGTGLAVAAGGYRIEVGSAKRGWIERRAHVSAGELQSVNVTLPEGGVVHWVDPMKSQTVEEYRERREWRAGFEYWLFELREDVNSLVEKFDRTPARPMELPRGVYEVVAYRGPLPVAHVSFEVESDEITVPLPTPAR